VFSQAKKGDLLETVEARGSLEASNRQPLSPSSLPANAVVTATYAKPGALVRNGEPVLAVNGSPVLVIRSPFRFYRDLQLGASGPDVRQLQLALADMGSAIPSAERSARLLGPGTAAALAHVLHGAEPAVPTALGLEQVVTASTLPARLASLAPVGRQVVDTSALAVLESGPLVVTASFTSGDAAVLRQGLTAAIDVEPGGPVSLTVARVAATSEPVGPDQASGADAAASGDGGLALVTLEANRPIPEAWRGRSGIVRVSVRLVASSALLVPLRAVASNAHGEAAVLKRVGGSTVAVPVVVLGRLDGTAAVRSEASGGLNDGDYVQVG